MLVKEQWIGNQMEPLVQLALPPDGIGKLGKRCYSVQRTAFYIDDKYVPLKPLGKGAYGVVCSALNLENNEVVAIKKISDVFRTPTTAIRTLRELMILRRIRHDNLIALKDVMIPSNKTCFNEVYLVFELMRTDLHHVIQSPRMLSNHHIKYFMFQILSGLNYLHSANILHRDLKPSNILVNSNGDVKICDFGLARTAAGSTCESMSEYVVTRWYRAPELLLGCHNYGPSIDVWSVGCILAELIGRSPLFQGNNPVDQLILIVECLGTPKHEDLQFIPSTESRRFLESLPHSAGTPFTWLFSQADPEALNLLEKMLEFNPSKRITVAEALRHPYLADLCRKGIDSPVPFLVDLDVPQDGIRDKMWEEMLAYQYDARMSCLEKMILGSLNLYR